MRGKSSSSKSRNGGLEFERSNETQLSGAYIRSLVKQLTSSRTKDSLNQYEHESLEGVEGISSNQSSLCRNGFPDDKPHPNSNRNPNPPPQQHKKQVRRRLHANRPYQERLLNMAEARREIVTALKFHRAAMKQQATEKQQQQQQQQQQMESGPVKNPPFHSSWIEQDAKLKSIRNPRIYASNSSMTPPQGYCCPYSWSVSSMSPPPLAPENLNFALPTQPLGLNLNLKDFTNLDIDPASIFSCSSGSTSSSSPDSTKNPPSVAEHGDSGLHPAMGDQEMAEIRSIGEQYQMEWNDTMNLVNSAWWFKFLRESENEGENREGEDFVHSPFDEVAEFPAWLNANETCLQQVNDSFQDNYLAEHALPCMEIEEIEGMDGDWLS